MATLELPIKIYVGSCWSSSREAYDQEIVFLDLDGITPQRDRWLCNGGPVRQTKLPPVPWAGHDLTLSSSLREWTTQMWTHVIHRVKLAFDIKDGNFSIANFLLLHFPLRYV